MAPGKASSKEGTPPRAIPDPPILDPAIPDPPILNPLSVDAVILCGGFGTRLRSAVSDRPKPMALVGGRPFLEILVEHVRAAGFRRFVFCVHYLAEQIRAHFERFPGIEAEFSLEREPLGTGGALRLARERTRSEELLVLNGDSFCAADLAALRSFHHRRRALATLALVEAPPEKDGGLVSIGNDGEILSFIEKGSAAGGRHLNAGVYVFRRELLDQIPAGRKVSLETEVFPSLIGGGLFGFPCDAPLFDIGTPERLERFIRERAGGHEGA